MDKPAKWSAVAIVTGLLVAAGILWATARLTSPPETSERPVPVGQLPRGTEDESSALARPPVEGGTGESVSATDTTPAGEATSRDPGRALPPRPSQPPGAPAPPDGAASSAADQPDELSQQCRTNLKMLCLALLMYSSDYDGPFPIASQWCDSVYPYLKNEKVFCCPAASAGYGYSLNRGLDRSHLKAVYSPATTVMVFDSSAGAKNASDLGQSLCRPPRHPDGNNFGYVDGHAVAQTSPQQFAVDRR
jgi:prepilin-type processing-associated H-X9-DG protein